MQCIYYNDSSLQNEKRSLKELGVVDGSEFDFCVDEGIVCMQCSFQEHSVSSNHTERSLVSVFSQDIYSVVDMNWI